MGEARLVRAVFCAGCLVMLLAGCTGTGRPQGGVEKSVVEVSGVRHAPVLVAPDTVSSTGAVRGWAEADRGPVLVLAALQPGSRPLGQAPSVPGAGGRVEFSFPIPPGSRGRVLVRAIDRQGLFTDKIVEIRD